MNPTALGRIIGLLAMTLFAVAFVVGSVAPALAGVALFAYRDAAAAGRGAGKIEATRHAPPISAVGLDIESVVDVTAEHPVPLRIAASQGAVRSTGGTGRGHAHLDEVHVAAAPGEIQWETVEVHTSDRFGLWEWTHRVPAPASTRVRPEADHVAHGRRQGKRFTVQSAVHDPIAPASLPEVRMIRPYDSSDRARDIDWRISTRTGELHVRDRERASPRKYVILLDATRSMRRTSRAPKLTSASNLVMSLAGAAQGAGVTAALVAFHEQGAQRVGDIHSRAAHEQLMQALSWLPAPTEAESFRVTTDVDRPITSDERHFLQLVAPLANVPATPSLDNALATLDRVTGGPAFVVAIMDGEVNPRRAEVAVQRLQAKGHSVVLVVPATGAHHFTRKDAPVDELRIAKSRRDALVRAMAARKVPVLSLFPDNADHITREVARYAV